MTGFIEFNSPKGIDIVEWNPMCGKNSPSKLAPILDVAIKWYRSVI